MHFIFWLLVWIGAMTAIANGGNVATSAATWQSDLVWGLFAFGGVGLIVLALFLRKWGLV